jgi:hypothetical protein
MYRYGVGQTPDSFTNAQLVASTMEGMLQQIEPGAKFGKPSYTAEVTAYQKAGQYGAQVVGPAIDSSGAPMVTIPLTHQAWDLNRQLHSDIATWGPLGPGYQDVQKARTLAWHMLVGYKQAILSGRQSAIASMQQRPAPTPRQVIPPSGPLQAAAQGLVAAIHTAVAAGGPPARWSAEFGQAKVMWQPTAKFQKAYNVAAGGSLKVDGVYGTQTQKALQSVVGTNTIEAAYGVAGWY